ncbi:MULTISPECIES: alpha/beta hydrolase [unclassified Lactococcus]|uniref:alpha/beta hydrolase n=1 Tax=unclassified Lactococcus TaxID=2643510 RepID=UPI0011C91ECF|nr:MULTISPECIES: alpha/beta hydrolase [unclassified Lactococcus]MQW22170.1 alpha/beta hydrolase [Lactococcus sp. dk101]TXK45105.1 alpha/beta hydrolase [Lactococcus sp. dk310]TXK51115.1 alpha/beta hydrolase [Lactococcus sp. dk322]
MADFYIETGNKKLAPVLLLHSTGGDEFQLLPIARQLFENHPLIAIRGRISEQGINRYFKLKGPAFTKENFDLASLAEESDWLISKINQLLNEYELDGSQLIALGYSNGANVALNMQQKGLVSFDKIIAFHAMQLEDLVPISMPNPPKIWLSHADNDSIVSKDNFDALTENLSLSGCQLEIYKSQAGHQLTASEIAAVQAWMASQPEKKETL